MVRTQPLRVHAEAVAGSWHGGGFSLTFGPGMSGVTHKDV